jgi:epoxyqueuosine reductase
MAGGIIVMITKQDMIELAGKYGFEDIGFTTAEPFSSHKAFLETRQKEYGWAETIGLALMDGTDPKTIMPEAKTIVVLMEVYLSPLHGRPFRPMLSG